MALPLLLIPYAALAMWYGPVYGGVRGLVPIRMRAIAAAVLLFIINILGAVAGPSVFGWFNDLMTNRNLGGPGLDVEVCKAADGAAKAACAVASAHGIKTTAYISTAVIPLAMLCFWLSRWTVKKDFERAETMPAAVMPPNRIAFYLAVIGAWCDGFIANASTMLL